MKNLKFSVAADIHVDLFQNLALLNEDLLTDRALEIDLVFKEIIDRTLENGINYLFIAGDLFHRRNIRSDAINNLVRSRLKYAKDKGLQVILIAGNHDQASVSGKVTVLSMFSDICTVVDKPEIITIEGIDFFCLPYEEYLGSKKSLEILLKSSRNPSKVLLAHIGIIDALLSGFDHVSKEPIKLSELHLEEFIYGYFGHYHLPQTIGKHAMYVGSPCAHSLSDKDVDRGYIEAEITLKGTKYVASNKLQVIESPKFLEVKAEDYNPSDYKGKHYIKVTNANREQVIKLQEDENIMSTTGESIVQVVDSEKVIQGNLSWGQMVEKYVRITEQNKRKHKRLVRAGKGFLNE